TRAWRSAPRRVSACRSRSAAARLDRSPATRTVMDDAGADVAADLGIAESRPADGATDVVTDLRMAVRFTAPIPVGGAEPEDRDPARPGGRGAGADRAGGSGAPPVRDAGADAGSRLGLRGVPR